MGIAARFLGFNFGKKIKTQQAMQSQMNGNKNEAVSMTTGDNKGEKTKNIYFLQQIFFFHFCNTFNDTTR